MRIIRVYPIMLSDTFHLQGSKYTNVFRVSKPIPHQNTVLQNVRRLQLILNINAVASPGLKTCIMICNDLMWFNSAMQSKKYKAEERALLMLQTQVTTQWRHNSGQWLGHRWLRKPYNNCDTALTWSNILSDDLVPCVVIIHSQLWDTESLPPARSHNQGHKSL